jgi:D-inositol-3-phosphate glycosyltransferase
MKVVIATTFLPPHVGGLEVVAQQQAETLAAAGHDVCVVTSRHDRALPKSERSDAGYRIVRVPVLNTLEDRTGIPYPVVGSAFLRACWREIRAADQVHVHDTFYQPSQLAALVARLLHKPMHITQHVGVVDHPKKMVMHAQNLIYGLVAPRLWNPAESITVYNANVREFLRGRGVEAGKIREVRNGIDVGVFRPVSTAERRKLRLRLGLPADGVFALFVGRLVPKKGYSELLEARSTEFDIVFAGPGKVPEPCPPNVRFLGAVDREDIVAWYQVCDVFVLPALGEIFPLAMQEAMACGLPVVAYDDPRYAEYEFDRTLISLVEREPDQIRAAILRVVRDPSHAARMSAYGRELAETRFDWGRNHTARPAATRVDA